MLAELSDAAVEGLDGGVGAGEHDSAFHYGQNVSREGLGVGLLGEIRDLLNAFAHGSDPAAKVFGDQVVRGAVLGVDFEGQAAQGTAVLAAGLEDALAVAFENREDALDGPRGARVGGIDDRGPEGFEVDLEDGAKQSLFTFEEVIEAAGVDARVSQEVGHAGAGEAAFPEKMAGGGDQAVAGFGGFGHLLTFHGT
jgi:hypothetical protein